MDSLPIKFKRFGLYAETSDNESVFVLFFIAGVVLSL